MARLVQVGERLHNDAIGLLESLHASRFCSAAPAPHAKPCHDTLFPTFLDLDFSSQIYSRTHCASAPHQSAATEQLSSQQCKHFSQMTEMLNDGGAVRPAMSRIQSIARSNFAGRHPVALSSYFYISRTIAHCSRCSASTLAATRHELFAYAVCPRWGEQGSDYSELTSRVRG